MVKWRGGKGEDDAAVAVWRGGSNRKLKRGVGGGCKKKKIKFFRVRFFSSFFCCQNYPPFRV
jgi:hypothetical protein